MSRSGILVWQRVVAIVFGLIGLLCFLSAMMLFLEEVPKGGGMSGRQLAHWRAELTETFVITLLLGIADLFLGWWLWRKPTRDAASSN